MAAPAAAESPPRDPLEKARKIAAEIARDAGKILMQGLGTRPAVGFKSEDINLVTDGAQGYFGEKLGFKVVDRKDVAAEIAATAEYALARSKNANWMRKDL